MPIINNFYTSPSQLIDMSATDKGVFFCTLHHGIILFDIKEYKLHKVFQHKDLDENTLAMAFSKNGKRVAFSTKKYLYVVDLASGEVLKKIDTQTKHIIKLSFDNSSKYIVAGTKDARVMLYRYNSNLHIARLFSFGYKQQSNKFRNHFISSMAYYKNLIGVAGHGGIIFVVDIYSQANKYILFHNTFLKTALHFIDADTILCGDSNGDLQFISIEKNKVLKTIHLDEKKIVQIKQIPDTRYLIVHAGSKKIYVIDAKEKTVLHSKYVKFEDRVEFAEVLDADNLIVSLNTNKMLHIELPSVKRLKSLILHNSIDAAFNLVEQEPMLIGTDEHKKLEKIYTNSYNKALDALMRGDETLAKNIMSIYMGVESKKDSIKLLFKAFENYNRFNILYLDKKYSICYAMSEKYPPLRMTKEHQKMEKKWKETFTTAQKYIKGNRINHAKNIFHEFIPVQAKRHIIHLMLMHNNSFIEFIKAVNDRNFKVINRISQQNKLFLQMPIFETLQDEVRASIKNIKSLIEKNKIGLAKENLKKIEDMPNFNKEVEELYSMCEDVEELQNAYDESDFFRCYELIDEYPHLQNTELGILLHKHWFKVINRCENYAIKGSVKDIKATLGELIKLKHRREKIGSLLRLAFQVHIMHLISKRKYNSAKNLIYSYIDIFTKDTEIMSLMDSYEYASKHKLAITQTEFTNQSRDAWVNSSIVD
jgi:uncharacterized protein Veg